jgi:hypothetical protein
MIFDAKIVSIKKGADPMNVFLTFPDEVCCEENVCCEGQMINKPGTVVLSDNWRSQTHTKRISIWKRKLIEYTAR